MAIKVMAAHHDRHILPSRGMTLVEVLVALSVLSILLAIGVPAFNQFVISNRLSAYSSDMLSTLTLARSEAIKRNSQVVLCKSADGETCAGAGSWNQGWIEFADPNNNANRDAGEPIVYKMPALQSGYALDGVNGFISSVSYDSQGGVTQAGTFILCPPTPAASGQGQEIVVSASGRPRASKIASCP
ncbi:MAG: GspH/FimT family pseudopilin [Pseudomonadota bacterium]